MAQTCPRCGLADVDRALCPRCGVEVARFRAEMAGAVLRTDAGSAQPPSAPGPGRRRPAGFWVRAVALLIDGVALTVAQGALAIAGWLSVGVDVSPRPLGAALQLFSFVLGTGYPIVFHWQWGQTLGKMAMQIRVVDVGGGPLTLGQATGRQFASWLSALILCIGYVMAGIREDKRALHDLIAGTRVVRVR